MEETRTSVCNFHLHWKSSLKQLLFLTFGISDFEITYWAAHTVLLQISIATCWKLMTAIQLTKMCRHRLQASTLDRQLFLNMTVWGFILKDLGKTKSCPMVRDHLATIIFRPAKSHSQFLRLTQLTPMSLFLPIPSYHWTSYTGLRGLCHLSGAPSHMLKELALLLVVCLHATCGQRVRVWLWCSARTEEQELVTRGPCPEEAHLKACTSAAACLSLSHRLTPTWLTLCDPMQRHTKESHISREK